MMNKIKINWIEKGKAKKKQKNGFFKLKKLKYH